MVERLTSPRIIKTHLSWQMLPAMLKSNPKSKVSLTISDNILLACSWFNNNFLGKWFPLISNIFQIIYVTRNPKDACVSFHNHWKILEGYQGSFTDFADSFVNDVAGYYSPFIPHVLGNQSIYFVNTIPK